MLTVTRRPGSSRWLVMLTAKLGSSPWLLMLTARRDSSPVLVMLAARLESMPLLMLTVRLEFIATIRVYIMLTARLGEPQVGASVRRGVQGYREEAERTHQQCGRRPQFQGLQAPIHGGQLRTDHRHQPPRWALMLLGHGARLITSRRSALQMTSNSIVWTRSYFSLTPDLSPGVHLAQYRSLLSGLWRKSLLSSLWCKSLRSDLWCKSL